MKQASILVVEDERIVAFDLKQQLEALGYRVATVVPSGELAIEKATELKPDLVLMDIHLEGAMDGVEAAERIHACLRIPVIFLTAYAGDETLSRAQVSLAGHIDTLFGSAPEPVSETHEAFLAREHPEDSGDIERVLREALRWG